jgi:hypothetical protein
LGQLNLNNTIEEEIKERIKAGNKAFYSNQKLLRSKLLSRKSRLKLYRTLIRPIVRYASETWVLKENSIEQLMIFERKMEGKPLQALTGPECSRRLRLPDFKTIGT